jgi:zinc protease
MMSSHRFAASLAAALIATFAFSTGSAVAQTTVTSERPASFTLDNGLQVLVIPDRRTPVVTQMIWYKVGSADETPGKSGLAHFLEHLMFKGTAKHPAGEFSQTVLRIGGNENAFTSLDYTGYFQRVPREHLAKMMEFEADRMTGLILKDENVLPERDVVLEEFNMRVANNPDARLSEQIMAALYLNHPYGRPIIGWRQEIEKLDREDALAFYKRFYAPNNAILVIAGDVDAKEVRPMVEKAYGGIPAQPSISAQRIRPQEPVPAAPRTVTLSDPRVEQTGLRRYYLVPSSTTGAAGEGPALDVLAQLMGGGSNSYLYRALVIDRPLAVSAGAGYQGTSLDASQFSISVSPKPGVEFSQVEQAIDGVIANVIQNPARAEDLERVKTQLIAEAIYAQDNQATLARWYGAALTTGLSIDDIRSWPDRIRAVTAEQVRDAAQKWLEKNRSVTGYLIKDTTAKREEKSTPLHAAAKIQRLISPGGIEAWFVQDATVPLIAMEYAFSGGAAQDPSGKSGVGNMVAGLLDEGSGDLDSKTFHERLERRAIELSFSSTRDYFRGSLRMLKDNKDEAFDLLQTALTSPHFDAADVERIRAQVLSGLRRDTTNPTSLASRKFLELAFGDHPYGRQGNGTLDSVPKIDVPDMKDYVRRVIAKDTLRIAVVGDVDADTLGKLLDKTFGGLPAKASLTDIADVEATKPPQRAFVPLDVPQTVVTFGGPGVRRHDPNFMAAYVVNHILGGGGLSSRLYKEVREKRGLAYSVYQSLLWMDRSALFIGNTGTRADRAGETVDAIEKEIRRIAEEGPTQKELDEAKSYLKGSQMLALDTSSKLAQALLQYQLDKLPIDYIEKRNAIVDAVTLDDAKKAAQKLWGQGLLTVIVGRAPQAAAQPVVAPPKAN